uniref:Uncharacterized protein n=1 Tax=Anguilla anguilla TaxID=7936 RepID=A0A0E9QWD0_ANGAN
MASRSKTPSSFPKP